MTTCEYHQVIDLCEGVQVEFVDAGHLLGSASVIVTATEGGVTKRIVFSGDIGNVDQPIIRDPSYIDGADYVVMESTYGDRNHTEVWSYTDDLAAIIDETIAKGGNVVIPSFAVGRTQELLYFIREIKDKGMVKSDPDFPVYIDSPLAKKATTIFTGDLRGYLDEEALELVQDGTHMFSFSNLRMTETSEESKALNMDRTPKVIISASGMCDAGRIRHHLKHNLWRPECTVVFVGYQGEGTLGRSLLEGVDSVKLFGEEIAVHAKIVNFQGLSSHADRDHLLAWIQAVRSPKPQHVFVVHGDREVAPFFARSVESLGFSAHAPQYTEVYDLIAGKVLDPGYLPERKAKRPAPPTSGWWPWATCSWSPSSAAAGGTTSPWRALPTSCGPCWRSGRVKAAPWPGRRRPGTRPPAPCHGAPPRRPRILSACPSGPPGAAPGAVGTGGLSAC